MPRPAWWSAIPRANAAAPISPESRGSPIDVQGTCGEMGEAEAGRPRPALGSQRECPYPCVTVLSIPSGVQRTVMPSSFTSKGLIGGATLEAQPSGAAEAEGAAASADMAEATGGGSTPPGTPALTSVVGAMGDARAEPEHVPDDAGGSGASVEVDGGDVATGAGAAAAAAGTCESC